MMDQNEPTIVPIPNPDAVCLDKQPFPPYPEGVPPFDVAALFAKYSVQNNTFVNDHEKIIAWAADVITHLEKTCIYLSARLDGIIGERDHARRMEAQRVDMMRAAEQLQRSVGSVQTTTGGAIPNKELGAAAKSILYGSLYGSDS